MCGSSPWAATGGMDKKLIIWDLQHSLPRCTCEHEVCLSFILQKIDIFSVLRILEYHSLRHLLMDINLCNGLMKNSYLWTGWSDMFDMAGHIQVSSNRLYGWEGSVMG